MATTSILALRYPTAKDSENVPTDLKNLASDVDAAKLLTTAGYAYFRDEKTANTEGGTFTSGAWQTRTLNTSVTNNITNASLSSNQISLPAGTYYCNARCPSLSVTRHKAALYNVTDSAFTIIGSSAFGFGSHYVTNDSVVKGVFTITGTKAFELRHRCDTTKTTDGFGVAANIDSKVEVYAEIELWKVA